MSNNPPKIPVGKFRARAQRGEFGYTEKGNEQVMVIFELTDPELAGETVPWWGYFTERTAERTMQSLRFCGWKGDDVTTLDGLTDNEVEVEIEHNTYKGKTNARVAWVNRVGGGLQLKTPMAEAQRKAFAQKMKALAVKTRKEAEAAPAPAVDPNDDVGF